MCALKRKIIPGDNDNITFNDVIVEKVNEFTSSGSVVTGISSAVGRWIPSASSALSRRNKNM